MDYQFFESLTEDDAKAYLNRFREVEQQALQDLEPVAANAGVRLDYSMSSLPDVLKWMAKQVRMFHAPVPEDVPAWIRQAHAEGLTEFDDESKTIVLRAAYYLGECFAQLPQLRWTIGDVKCMGANMPVVAGFDHHLELSPLVVVDNLFAKIAGGSKPETEIDSTIKVWKGLLR